MSGITFSVLPERSLWLFLCLFLSLSSSHCFSLPLSFYASLLLCLGLCLSLFLFLPLSFWPVSLSLFVSVSVRPYRHSTRKSISLSSLGARDTKYSRRSYIVIRQQHYWYTTSCIVIHPSSAVFFNRMCRLNVTRRIACKELSNSGRQCYASWLQVLMIVMYRSSKHFTM